MLYRIQFFAGNFNTPFGQPVDSTTPFGAIAKGDYVTLGQAGPARQPNNGTVLQVSHQFQETPRGLIHTINVLYDPAA
jgi:hypothetical protein